MGFTTYENRNNPHAAIHRDTCNQLRKRGGVHTQGQGKYEEHDTYEAALAHAQRTGLKVSPYARG
jgi:hypothetical protein